MHFSISEEPCVKDLFWHHGSLTAIFKQGEKVNPMTKAGASKAKF
jgi:hypothetical protein